MNTRPHRRIIRWLTVGIALNLLGIVNVLALHMQTPSTIDLWIPAAQVTPYYDPSEQPDRYLVKDYDIAETVSRWGWPGYWQIYGALGVNLVFLTALLWSLFRSYNGVSENGGELVVDRASEGADIGQSGKSSSKRDF